MSLIDTVKHTENYKIWQALKVFVKFISKTDITIKHKNGMHRSKMSATKEKQKIIKIYKGWKRLFRIFNVSMGFDGLVFKDRAYPFMLQEQRAQTGQGLHFKCFGEKKEST